MKNQTWLILMNLLTSCATPATKETATKRMINQNVRNLHFYTHFTQNNSQNKNLLVIRDLSDVEIFKGWCKLRQLHFWLSKTCRQRFFFFLLHGLDFSARFGTDDEEGRSFWLETKTPRISWANRNFRSHSQVLEDSFMQQSVDLDSRYQTMTSSIRSSFSSYSEGWLKERNFCLYSDLILDEKKIIK